MNRINDEGAVIIILLYTALIIGVSLLIITVG